MGDSHRRPATELWPAGRTAAGPTGAEQCSTVPHSAVRTHQRDRWSRSPAQTGLRCCRRCLASLTNPPRCAPRDSTSGSGKVGAGWPAQQARAAGAPTPPVQPGAACRRQAGGPRRAAAPSGRARAAALLRWHSAAAAPGGLRQPPPPALLRIARWWWSAARQPQLLQGRHCRQLQGAPGPLTVPRRRLAKRATMAPPPLVPPSALVGCLQAAGCWGWGLRQRRAAPSRLARQNTCMRRVLASGDSWHSASLDSSHCGSHPQRGAGHRRRRRAGPAAAGGASCCACRSRGRGSGGGGIGSGGGGRGGGGRAGVSSSSAGAARGYPESHSTHIWRQGRLWCPKRRASRRRCS